MVIRVCLNKWTTDIVRIVFRLWANSTYRGWESKPHWFVGNWHEKTQTLRLESHWNDVFNHNFLGWTNVIILYNIIHHVSLILYLFFSFVTIMVAFVAPLPKRQIQVVNQCTQDLWYLDEERCLMCGCTESLLIRWFFGDWSILYRAFLGF